MMRLAPYLMLMLMLSSTIASAQAGGDDQRLIERTRSVPSPNLLPLAVAWFEPKAPLSPAALPMVIGHGPADNQLLAEAVTYGDATASTALLVWKDDRLLLERYGPGAGPATRTQSQSMHKSVLALMVALAMDDGLISSLDAPVADYLGAWTPQPLGTIRLRHLLEMSSGLALAPMGETGQESFANRLFNASDIAAVALSAPQEKPPGTVFEYNNVNPQLLLAVLEKATGEPYAAYLSRRIWSGVAGDPGDLWLDRPGGAAHGYCCLIASARDWVRIGRLLLKDGGLLSAARRDALLAPSATNPAYGQLVWRGNPWSPVRVYRPGSVYGVKHSAPYLADDLVFLDGFGGQRVYIVPSKNLVIVRTGAVAADWDDAILPNVVLRAMGPSSPAGTLP